MNSTSPSKATSTTQQKYGKFSYGTKKTEAVKKLETFKFPSEPFTMSEIISKFGFSHELLLSHLKENTTVVGEAPKRPGARGPAAKLYKYTPKTSA